MAALSDLIEQQKQFQSQKSIKVGAANKGQDIKDLESGVFLQKRVDQVLKSLSP